jgi:hypothetical protein
MITEGALLPRDVRGTLVDVTPAKMTRKVYRSGVAFGVLAGHLVEETTREILSHL